MSSTILAARAARPLALGALLFAVLGSTTWARAQQAIDGQPSSDVHPPVFLAGPVLSPGPSPRAPLVAMIDVETDEPSTILLALKDGERTWHLTADPKLAQVHHVPVLGVHPGLTHSINVFARDAAGNQACAPNALVWTTPSLPADFPPMQVTVSVPGQMERGVTLFDASSPVPSLGYFVMVDAQGRVVWYFEPEDGTGDVRRLRNGHFLCLAKGGVAMEFDVLGNVLQRWYAARLHPDQAPPGATLVDTDSFHHEIGEMPTSEEADFYVLSSEVRTYPDYPASETDSTLTDPTADVVGDVVVEFRRDGTIVNEIHLLDALDPYRVCYDSLSGFWNSTYGLSASRDWSHGNALFFMPYDDTFAVSLRSQDAIVKLRRTGEVVWILGPHERWQAPWDQYLLTPVGSPFEWQYHQHAPEIQTDGSGFLVYDNGNGRATPPAAQLPWAQRYSRDVQFQVDPQGMTVRQMWCYGGPNGPTFYSATRGDADRMPVTRNVLSVDADRKDVETGAPGYSRIVEVKHTDTPQVVFEMYVRELSTTQPRTWNVYRAERLPSVYPPAL